SFLGSRRLPGYPRLPPVEPSGHGFFSQTVPPAPSRPFPDPESLSPRLPEPAFSDTSPFLEDSGIVFLGAAASAIPTEAAVHRSAPAYWRTAAESDDFPSTSTRSYACP